MSGLPGDIVQRRKGLVMHTGVLLDDGRVLHNAPGRGEHVSSLDDFKRGQRLRVRTRSRVERDAALARVDSVLARRRGYNLLVNNCEHTAYSTAEGRSRSPQLGRWLLAAGIAGATLLATRSPALAGGAAALVSRWRRGA